MYSRLRVQQQQQPASISIIKDGNDSSQSTGMLLPPVIKQLPSSTHDSTCVDDLVKVISTKKNLTSVDAAGNSIEMETIPSSFLPKNCAR